MENSKIQWTDHTFNPWEGCTKVSQGCAHCYAEAITKRFGKKLWGPGVPRQRTSEAYWKKPLRWNAVAAANGVRFKVFCASEADVFDQEVPAEWRYDLFGLALRCPHLDWLFLTKRSKDMRDFVTHRNTPGIIQAYAAVQACPGVGVENPAIADARADWLMAHPMECWPPKNWWFGASVENQDQAIIRIVDLLQTPAAVRFLSCEPLLGPIEFESTALHDDCDHLGADCCASRHIQWVIVGGESGPNARPCDIEWVRSIVRQCREVGVAPFVKQLGSKPVSNICFTGEEKTILDLKDKKGGDPAEWPPDLGVREFPR